MSDKPARDAKGRLLPGHTANRSGQPGWVAPVRAALEESCKRGALLLRKIIDGDARTKVVTREGEVVEVEPTFENRLKAVDIAFSYSLGKPKVALQLEDSAGNSMAPVIGLFASGAELLEAIRATEEKE